MDPKQIEYLLEKLGLSERALAQQITVSPSLVRSWLEGKTKPQGRALAQLKQMVWRIVRDQSPLSPPPDTGLEQDTKTSYGLTAADVKQVRFCLELSQDEFAERLAIPTEKILAWENGRQQPTTEEIVAIRLLVSGD